MFNYFIKGFLSGMDGIPRIEISPPAASRPNEYDQLEGKFKNSTILYI